MMTLKEYVNLDKNFSFPEDVVRIKKILNDKNIEITLDEAEDIWDEYSDDMCAQWMGLPSDDEKVFEIVIEVAQKRYRKEY